MVYIATQKKMIDESNVRVLFARAFIFKLILINAKYRKLIGNEILDWQIKTIWQKKVIKKNLKATKQIQYNYLF